MLRKLGGITKEDGEGVAGEVERKPGEGGFLEAK